MNSVPIRLGILLAATVLATLRISAAFAERNASLPAGLQLQPNFRLELVYRVPAAQGSWVSLTSASRGRLVASDQMGKLYLIEPSAIGGDAATTRVTAIDLNLGQAHGLVCVGNDLYVMVNSNEGLTTGLHRARDADGDGIWETTELLRPLNKSGEHGPHAVIAGPDGKSLFVCGGNDTVPTTFTVSRLPGVGPDDTLLTRLIEPMPWHGVYRKPPAGWIARTDLDGKNWELFSAGYRNEYDIAFNRDGELFAYDSDMEYDIGTSWYRPTRICHATPGSDFGWRFGTGKYPSYYADTLPPVVELGPGSPTGLAFAYDTNFPAPYRDSLLAADWGRGIIHSIELSPRGSSYEGKVETLVRATPLPVTDMAANPHDKALYFTTGGRGIESSVYRLVYVGASPSEERQRTVADPAATAAQDLRRQLEGLQKVDATAVNKAWPALDHSDRFIRYAARIAIEHQPLLEWEGRALAEPLPARRLAIFLSLARQAGERTAQAMLDVLPAIAWDKLTTDQRRDLLRIYEVLLARCGPLMVDAAARVSDQLLKYFPDQDRFTTREMATVLSRLSAVAVTPRLVEELTRAGDDEDRIHLAHTLCDVNVGWSPELRTTYFQELAKLTSRFQESTLYPYVEQIANQAVQSAPESQRATLTEELAVAKERLATAPKTVRPFVREWTVEEALISMEKSTRTPDLALGERLFIDVGCAACHRVGARGGAVGPDLTTVGGRFTPRDLVTAIIEPNRVIADQYRQTLFEVGGRIIVGSIIDQRGGTIQIVTDMTDPKKKRKSILLADIDSQSPSDISPMPQGLVNVLNADELVDLVGYLRAGAR